MAQVTTPTQFRLRLDVPHSYAIEPGFSRDHHCHDMRPDALAVVNTWNDPITGLIMLRPSFLTADFYRGSNWRPLTQWAKNPAYWQAVFGNVALSDNTAAFFSTVLPAGGDGTIPSLTNAVANVAIASTLANDTIRWVMQSSFTMVGDEAFVIHMHAITHEKHQYLNWFALQFDDLALHFGFDGSVHFYQYQNGIGNAPTLLDVTTIATPGDLGMKANYFIVIPVPGMGLNLYHSHSAQQIDARVSSAVAGVTKGYQFKLKRTDPASGDPYVHKGGQITFGVGPGIDRVAHSFGYHQITFPTGTGIATFNDNVFDIGYAPSIPPQSGTGVILPHHYGSGVVHSAARLPDDSAAWAPSTNVAKPLQQARIKLTIDNNDAAHTPFILSTYIAWSPVFATRTTTATLPDRLFRLEFSEDDMNRFEGKATTMATSDAYRAICERGDTTFQVEKSLDGGTTWIIHNGGLAQIEGDVTVHLTSAGVAYIATWKLTGQEGRWHEATHTIRNAYDNMTLAGAINKTLNTCAETTIATFPADLNTITLPAPLEGQNWRFAPRLGEGGDEIIRNLLLMARKQNVEYRVWYNWAGAAWTCDARPRDTSAAGTWTFTPYPDEATTAALTSSRKVLMAAGEGDELFSFHPDPPEGNKLQPYGCSTPEPQGIITTGTVLTNMKSLTDPTSPDYLGRTKMVSTFFAPISDLTTVNQMGRRVYDASAHRRLQPIVPGREYIDALKPGVCVLIRCQSAAGTRGYFATVGPVDNGTGGSGSTPPAPPAPTPFWLKRRTVSLTYNNGAGDVAPVVTYTLDSIWESFL